MAIDLYADNSGGITTSPRISFSYDLSQSDTVPVEHLLRSISSSSSTVDFNFCVNENSDVHHASLADELFFDGKILTTEVLKSKQTPVPLAPVTPVTSVTSSSRRRNENLRSVSVVEDNEETKQQNSKSFWGFKRSSSCGNGYARSLCPITLLSRSHSTGSTTSSKRSSSSKDALIQKHNRSFQKPNSGSQKPPLRKSGYGYGNGTTNSSSNGIRVNPVLNLGFGSFFSGNSKNKNKK
ncbi:hypothetical protein QVD17_10152 [Tagetes erecta]|uniref:Uncharacterized protein n=1 Tax=Tagetes erecta TaxID=13708 RepID=A0AAD8L2B4_TARER|nr:hypothetical protein QVD17_10152 [Tagetes erecta]